MEHEPSALSENEAHIDAMLLAISAAWKTVEIEMINQGDHLSNKIPSEEPLKQSTYSVDDVMDDEWADPSF